MPDDIDIAKSPVPEGRFLDVSPDDWKTLFLRLADGDRDALGELYRIASRRLYGLALWRTGSPSDADEVVQEVFVRLVEKRDQLGRVADPRAWLLSVAHRVAVDLSRKRSRREARPLEECPYLEAATPDPNRRLDAARASRELARLPAKQREIVYLRHFADCTFAEAARIVGVPTFTAASRYRLGVAKLRGLLQGEQP